MKALQFLLLSIILVGCKMAKYPNLPNGIYADLQTDKGDVLLKLYEKEVPLTVANFVALAEGVHPKVTDSLKGKKYYDGTKFHRVIEDFMIQGGDYYGTGAGNAGYRFADEFPIDEEGKLLYKHNSSGVLSMANSGPNTNSSQFFITHKDTPWLDGKHSIFGKVQIGQNIVDTIQQGDKIKHVQIIRVGDKAKRFDAAKVFLSELELVAKKEEERLKKLEVFKKEYQEKMGVQKATKTDSGLKYLQLKKGNGKKVNPDQITQAHYTLYTADGRKLDSSLDRGQPISFTINRDPLIAGWKEGATMMEEGEKARLFIPYYLGYGETGHAGVIAPKTDLIFEIEIIKVGK